MASEPRSEPSAGTRAAENEDGSTPVIGDPVSTANRRALPPFTCASTVSTLDRKSAGTEAGSVPA